MAQVTGFLPPMLEPRTGLPAPEAKAGGWHVGSEIGSEHSVSQNMTKVETSQ